jgi:hypothetical protein
MALRTAGAKSSRFSPDEAARERRVPGDDRHTPLHDAAVRDEALGGGHRQDGGRHGEEQPPVRTPNRGLFFQLTLRRLDAGMNASKRVQIARSIDGASSPACASNSSRLP